MNYALILNEQHELLAKSLNLVPIDCVSNLRSPLSHLYVFEDTNSAQLRKLRSIGVKKTTLIQEGFFPYSDLPMTLKQLMRYASSRFSGPKGTRQMMYSADELILFEGQTVPKSLNHKISMRIPIKYLKKADTRHSPFDSIYFANDFLRIGCRSLHEWQLQRYAELRGSFPLLKFRPHPAEREFFISNGVLPSECMDLGSLRAPNICIGNISTALLQCILHGSLIYIDDVDSKFIKKSVLRNILPILDAAGVKYKYVHQLVKGNSNE